MSILGIEIEVPWLLLLLVLLVPYVWQRLRSLRSGAVRFSPLQYAPAVGFGRHALKALVALEVVLCCVVVLALAGPHRESEREIIKAQGLDIALSLDVSASMMAADFKPSRLAALRRMAGDFIKRSGGDRIAVYVFAKDVFTQTPLTTDHAVLLELLRGVSHQMIDHSKSGGTAMGDALLAAGEALLRVRVKGRDQVIILFTDGESNYGADPALAARYLRGHGIRFYVIGIGGDEAVPVYIDGKPFIAVGGRHLHTKLNDARLKRVTEAGGGRYFRARNADILAQIFGELSRLERTPLEVRTLRIRRYYSGHLALAGFALFLAYVCLYGFYVRRPWR